MIELDSIKAQDFLQVKDKDLVNYKLHLACWNGKDEPLDVFAHEWEKWVSWNEWKEGKDDFNRKFIFSTIQFYPEPNKWLFGGIFEVKKRLQDCYELELMELHKDLIGRLILDFTRYQGMRGRSFKMESFYKFFTISEVLKYYYDGTNYFPGFDNVTIDFEKLEWVYKYQKNDWKNALENVKGVYVIFDKKNGKKYVGAAYDDFGIWSRWGTYIQTGHGFNDHLIQIIHDKGIDYARKNFNFTLLEFMPMKTDNNYILKRETYWKEVLFSRGEYGYNRN